MSQSANLDPPTCLWLVCHTKPRCEKKFAALLKSAGIAHYLPLMESRKQYASGTKIYFKPLFPGYVFTHVPVENQKRLYEQQLIVGTLTVPDEKIFLRQLEQVRRVVAAGVGLALRPLFTPGRPVKITGGPLRGLEGYVENPDRPDSILLRVDVLQQGLLVSVASEWVQPLP